MAEPPLPVQCALGLPEFQVLIAHLREGLIALDSEDRICLCNPAAANMLGLEMHDLLGRLLSEVAPHRELHQVCKASLPLAGHSLTRQIAIGCDDEKRILELAVHPVAPAAGRRLRRIIYLTDATENAKSERIKADFVANASHELRTPLSTMRAAVETILETAERLDAHQRRFLELLAKNLDRLEELARDLLELARIESPNLAVQLEPVDLPAMLAEVQQDFDNRLRHKHVVLTTDLHLRELIADRRLLKRALNNLIDNSVKFAPPSTGRVTVRSSLGEHLAVIEIADNGSGIPAEDRERIFERFYQVDKARREGGDAGTGLGLAIVKHAMLAMGGSVELDPAVRQGTLIRLLLPQPL